MHMMQISAVGTNCIPRSSATVRRPLPAKPDDGTVLVVVYYCPDLANLAWCICASRAINSLLCYFFFQLIDYYVITSHPALGTDICIDMAATARHAVLRVYTL